MNKRRRRRLLQPNQLPRNKQESMRLKRLTKKGCRSRLKWIKRSSRKKKKLRLKIEELFQIAFHKLKKPMLMQRMPILSKIVKKNNSKRHRKRQKRFTRKEKKFRNVNRRSWINRRMKKQKILNKKNKNQRMIRLMQKNPRMTHKFQLVRFKSKFKWDQNVMEIAKCVLLMNLNNLNHPMIKNQMRKVVRMTSLQKDSLKRKRKIK